MTKPFFTEADCDVNGSRYSTQLGTSISIGPKAISLERANALLSERGKVIYGHHTGSFMKWFIDAGSAEEAKAKGIIICIEPIEQDSAEKLLALLESYSHEINAVSDKILKMAKAVLGKE